MSERATAEDVVQIENSTQNPSKKHRKKKHSEKKEEKNDAAEDLQTNVEVTLPQRIEEEKPKPNVSFAPIDMESSADEDCEILQEIDSLMDKLPETERHHISPLYEEAIPEENEDEEIIPVFATQSRAIPMVADLPVLKTPSLAVTPPNPEDEEDLSTFVQTGRVPMITKQNVLIQHAHRQRVNSILQGDYDAAKRYDEASHSLSLAVAKQMQEEKKQERMEYLQKKLEESKDEFFTVKTQWDMQIRSFSDSIKQRILELGEEKQAELKEFEEKWNSESQLRKYSKPSPRLLQLKSMERSMIIAKMFDKAKAIRKQAEELEKSETKEAQKKATLEMERQRERLVLRQAREIASLKEKLERQMDQLKRTRNIEEHPHKAKIAKYEKEIEALKNGCDTHVVPLVADKDDDLLTPRTVSKFSTFKSNAQFMKLKLKPMGAVSESARKKCVIRVRAATSMGRR